MGVYIIVVEIIYMQVVKNGNSGLREFPSEVGVWIFSGTTCTQTKSFLLIYIKQNLTSMQRPRSNVKLHIGQTNLSEWRSLRLIALLRNETNWILLPCQMKIYSGESRGGLPSLFWAKKEEMTEGRKAGTPPPLAQGLDLLPICTLRNENLHVLFWSSCEESSANLLFFYNHNRKNTVFVRGRVLRRPRKGNSKHACQSFSLRLVQP